MRQPSAPAILAIVLIVFIAQLIAESFKIIPAIARMLSYLFSLPLTLTLPVLALTTMLEYYYC